MSDEINLMILEYANDTVELEEIIANARNYNEGHQLVKIWIKSLHRYLHTININESDMKSINESILQIMMSNGYAVYQMPVIRLTLKMVARQKLQYLQTEESAKHNSESKLKELKNMTAHEYDVTQSFFEDINIENYDKSQQDSFFNSNKDDVNDIVDSCIEKIEDKPIEEDKKQKIINRLESLKKLYGSVKDISPELGPRLILDIIRGLFGG